MKKILGCSFALLTVLTFTSSTFAANVEVEWKNPENYRDIVAGNTEGKNKFQQTLFTELEATFSKSAKKLPENYHMKVVMIDVDLAGQVQQGRAISMRTVNDYDFPRLKFYMYLYDQNNNIVLQGTQNLKERKDKHNAFRMKGSQTRFYLEKDLIKKWFDIALIPGVAKL
ncbi:MAG: hypothetical protein COB35_04550 [Gammaproteobacteria bacterium]|nr:MAG: hypothetical protein COB35_04550 [Gammaproteobacteria bacterium]